ncbi:VCBS repeat-containing protein [Novosphingobium sp. Chol11]|uniref:FG-GAP repeat domain-containing protein n=1 Tax=Novosphingobium sp. Chol11 TaxID=1385763 RepID=UPI0025EDF74D|nr:VCBS repeat-containing protein [Novosphingobium sp. Chol11]
MLKVGKVGTEFRVNTQVANGSTGASYPAITRLANGGFVATWMDYSGTLGDSDGSSVKAQVFGVGGIQLGGEFLVNTTTASFQGLPSITDLVGGEFVVTWTDSSGMLGDSSESGIKAQLFGANGSKLGSEFLVNTQTAGVQNGSAVARLANGGFVVTWEDDDYGGKVFDPNGKSIRAQVYTAAGVKVGPELLVNTQTIDFQQNPTVTGLVKGGFVVAWVDGSRTLGDSDGSSIKAQLFTSGGVKVGTEFLVNTEVAGGQGDPEIASLTNGGFVVTWYDSSGTLGDGEVSSIKAQVFTAEGTKAGPEFLVNTQTANGQYSPTINGLTSGGFVITWRDLSGTLGDSDVTSIKAQVFSENGAKVSSEFLVNTFTAQAQFNSTVTGLSNGDFVVTWNDYSGSLAGGTPGTKAQIFTLADQPGSPVITSVRNDFNGDGRSDILWRNTNGQLSNWLGGTNGALTDNGGVVKQLVPVSWKIQGTADFNGDGRSDILWRNVNG